MSEKRITMKALFTFAASALALLSISASAQADSKALVTLISLDKASTVVGLQEAGGNCRFYGGLVQKNAGEFEVVLERKVCPDTTGGVDEETIKGTAWIGQFPELPYCAGKPGCLRALPAGASVTANF